ncbi:hypothetical protein GIB67_031071, partial [Kingdonia uniflora]
IDQSYDKVKECLKINDYGTKGVTKVIFPLLQFFNSARIVTASSVYGLLSFISYEKVKAQLRDINLTVKKLNNLMLYFLKDFKEDKLECNGLCSCLLIRSQKLL